MLIILIPHIHRLRTPTIGNSNKDWITDSLLEDNTFAKFYQGMIKNKGVTGTTEQFNRSSMLNDGTSVANIIEEWMFPHSYYGDTTNVDAPKLNLLQTSN